MFTREYFYSFFFFVVFFCIIVCNPGRLCHGVQLLLFIPAADFVMVFVVMIFDPHLLPDGLPYFLPYLKSIHVDGRSIKHCVCERDWGGRGEWQHLPALCAPSRRAPGTISIHSSTLAFCLSPTL